MELVEIVPHRCTVDPGPIWVEPEPQFPLVLKKLTALALAQLDPSWVPAAVAAMYTFETDPKPDVAANVRMKEMLTNCIWSFISAPVRP